MSIDMNKTETLYQKIDVISNLLEQMMLANKMRDQAHFNKSYVKASKLCFDAARQMEDMGLDEAD